MSDHKASNFSLSSYFERIGFKSDGIPEPTLETLQKLHYLHLHSIPFENLALHYGTKKEILIDSESIFNKLVVQKRGGYCFEQNGLFSKVLKELGYNFYTGMASVASEVDGKFRYLGRSHMVSIVKYEEQLYLADVGFGSAGLSAILPLKEDISFSAIDNQEFRFKRTTHPTGSHLDWSSTGFLLESRYLTPTETEWKPAYYFTLTEFTYDDYELSNYYTSTNPGVIFRQHVMVTMPTLDGRVTLFDRSLKIRNQEGIATKTILENDEEVMLALKEHFGIVIDLE
ncbi:hypothetical protein K7432_008883 [Basidiobolus ranarum]|uniref:Arylamine N-acetyltransferase n=1 Tax=Basidiobolus ranarum TaxID=34480 RepID=A0ABR2VXX2_9FUNG